MQSCTIHPASEQDIDSLIPLYIEFHNFHVLGVPDRLRKPDVFDETELQSSLYAIVQRADACIFVAASQTNLLGFAEVYLRQDEPHPLTVAHTFGYLQSLFVTASCRKNGLGKQLLTAAQQWAKEQHATEMQLETWEFAEGPLYFYEGRGYRTLKRKLVIGLD